MIDNLSAPMEQTQALVLRYGHNEPLTVLQVSRGKVIRRLTVPTGKGVSLVSAVIWITLIQTYNLLFGSILFQ